MTKSPQFSLSEAGREQLQALMTLSALGWRYVTRADADRQRRHRRTGVLLEDTLRIQLAALRGGPESFDDIHVVSVGCDQNEFLLSVIYER